MVNRVSEQNRPIFLCFLYVFFLLNLELHLCKGKFTKGNVIFPKKMTNYAF